MSEENCEKSTDLEPAAIRHRCRCGFTADTAQEVWDHQEAQLKECEESDCSGRIDECDHCPEITTGDAIEDPLFTAEQIHDLMERVHWDGEAENPWMQDTDPEKSSAWLEGWSAAIETLREEFTQGSDAAGNS